MFERALKSVDVVKALAREISLAEEVLIDVGNGCRVRIDSGVPGKDLHKLRTRSARQRDADARLQNAVTASHAIRSWIDAWFVERMDRGADELQRNIARQLSVGVERYDVAD